MSNIEVNLEHGKENKSRSKYLLYKGSVAVFHVRKFNPKTEEVEIWECKWTNPKTGKPQKEFIKKVGIETGEDFDKGEYSTAAAICWAPNRTIGNIAVNSKELLGKFEGKSGTDGILPCQIIPCGKFRHGAKRWYCKTHQMHWGTLADFESCRNSENQEMECSSKDLPLNYVVDPFELNFSDFEEIGIWVSLPRALSSRAIEKRAPKIHVHRRKTGQKEKDVDNDFDALVLSYNQNLGLFESEDISKIQVTPPSAFEFVMALKEGREVSCVSCKRCGYPHLDLGDFAKKAHKKHYCGNCGNDSIISTEPIVSTPLKPLHDQFNKANSYVKPNREINLDDDKYKGLHFDIWSSTPAIIWTANRDQEEGIHVHVYKDGKYLVDDTFSKVVYKGNELDRDYLWQKMLENTLA